MEKAGSVMVVGWSCNPNPEGGMVIGGNENYELSTNIYTIDGQTQ